MADEQSRAGLRYADPDIIAYVDGIHSVCIPTPDGMALGVRR